jgi:YVTN family beta-propeller protein
MANPASVDRLPLPDSAVRAKFTDTMDIDQEGHRLYYGDNWSGGVDVFDISTKQPKYLQTIRLRGMLYGVSVGKNVNKVFVGLTSSLVAVIDIDANSPTYHTVITRIDTGGRGAADLMDYDPIDKKLFVGNHDDGFVASIDAVNNKLLKRIEGLGAEIEQPRFNPRDGMVYVAGRVDNELYQIDPKTDTLVARIPIGDPCHPNGLAINPETNQMLIACSSKQKHGVLFDLNKQAVASVVNECGGGDGAVYVSKVNRFFYAAEDANGPVMGIFDGSSGSLLTTVRTEKGAGWVAYDETNDVIYAPAVENGKPSLLSIPLPAA